MTGAGRPFAVFDIDGVLADARHREHHVRGRPKDWEAFFAEVGGDPVIEEGRALLLSAADEHEVVLLSGRPERCRADTTAWLARNGFGPMRILLRPDVDHRPAADLKAELVRQVGSPDVVRLLVDDDAAVVRRLRLLGYHAELFAGAGGDDGLPVSGR